ncbi:NADH dehydrogenase [ubiquinone] 1 alpha subcomplex assembly factor 2 isoform X2 [Ictalurus furcatus]|uniref:NADH dehydrogenase [ubiquinone] 1 alpha subcomplex assembly factor 2 isoform X2 n=1 Tax=Ictalurus furcatus TaxID=66913 RepID=UPI0023501E6C|nr:NADH dehydrogenase [ubiquinone] 1 alpha subcomplex assembly factor 2 isoform X2 [Ictalurus furcatus]
MSRFASLLRRTFGVMKEHVGTDHLGNKYYYIPEQKTWTAWIRGRRKDPPTVEELLKNEHYREQIKVKAQEAGEKDRELQAKELAEGLITQPMQTQVKGHAAATQFGQSEISEEPVSTANTFQPGSWAPPKK